MKYLFISFIIALFSVNAFAQPKNIVAKGSVSGKVIDASTKQPVEYATVSIFKQGAASPFNGIATDPKGNFTVGSIPLGSYKVTIDFMGYQKKTIDNVQISGDSPVVSLGTVTLTPIQNELKTVNIVGQAATIENKIDKVVYNPGNDLSAQGGVAVDILKKVPQVTVDIDGNVELQGNSNIQFLINGKPSSIFGASLSDALQSIPASQIKSIEVITSPGAKYEASGTGGIINIILKESKVQGVNGNINLSAGTRRENGSFNLSAKKGNFGVNAFFSGNEQLNTNTLNTNNRTSTDPAANTTQTLFQKGNNALVRSGYQSGLSFDWSITKTSDLTASIGFNHFGNHTNGTTFQDQSTMSTISNSVLSDIQTSRMANSKFDANAIDYSLAYKKTFAKEGQELDILYNTSDSRNNANFFQQVDSLGNNHYSGVQSTNPGKDRRSDVSIDYTHPFSDSFTLETGAKGTFETINNSVATDTLSGSGFIPNANQTYGFNYNRKIYAGYLSAQFSLFNKFLDGKVGLRDEYTRSTADNATIPSYNILAPSWVIQHKFDKTQSIKFSYTYRIERPNYGDLNPFYNISDEHNISTGNPNLRPEKGHNYEFGYSKNYSSGANIYIAGFYRYNTDDLQQYTTHYDTLPIGGKKYTNVFLTQRFNIGTEKTEGITLFGSIPITKKFNLRSNMFFADRITTNPGNPTVSGFTYRINLNASYEFGNSLMAEVFGVYNASQRTIQGTRPAFGFYNIAVRKQFMNKKASIGLTAADPFNKYINQSSYISGPNFTQTSLRQIPFQSFGISLTYKFGKLDFKRDKEKDNQDNNTAPPEPPQ